MSLSENLGQPHWNDSIFFLIISILFNQIYIFSQTGSFELQILIKT